MISKTSPLSIISVSSVVGTTPFVQDVLDSQSPLPLLVSSAKMLNVNSNNVSFIILVTFFVF